VNAYNRPNAQTGSPLACRRGGRAATVFVYFSRAIADAWAGVVMKKIKKKSFLRQAKEFVDFVDPLRGPNLMRHSGLVDMGDGTLKVVRRLPDGLTSPHEPPGPSGSGLT
jgi:hypothetical protein